VTVRRLLGVIAITAGCAVAVVGLAQYEAWWTIAVAIAGVSIAVLAQPELRPLHHAVAIIDSLLVVATGAIATFIGLVSRQWGGPCVGETCRNPVADTLTVGGLGLVVIGGCLLAVSVRSLIRARRRT
jgi:hypothetical protein